MGETEFTRYRVKSLDKTPSGSPRAKTDCWQLIIERDVPNPDFVPRDESRDESGNKVADVRTANQKRRSKRESRTKMYDGEPVNEKKALEAARAWMEAANEGIHEDDGHDDVLVSDYLDQFLVSWERNVEASTMKDYRKIAKYIKEGFEGVTMRELDAKAVDAWLAGMHQRGLSAYTLRKRYALLNLMCKQAVMADDIASNPCDKVKAPKTPKPSPNPPTEQSFRKLTRILAEMDPTPLCVALHIGCRMGLREAEICALQWKCVDLESGMLTVGRAIGRGEGKNAMYLKEPKNDRSKRVLPMPAPLVDVLRVRKELMRAELATVGVSMDAEKFGELFVIGTIDGKYQNPEVLSRQWRGIALSYGIVGTQGRTCTFYDTSRHYFATEAIAQGNDVEAVAAFMGHDPTMTLRIYADATAKAKQNVAESMGNAF